MRTRLAIFFLVSVPLTATDLALKAVLPTQPFLHHHRSPGWEAGSLALLAVVLLLTRLPSRALAAAAGVFAAGIAGNLVSALAGAGDVPNPFVVGTLAFTLADALVLAGFVLLGVTGMRLAFAHRNLLPTAPIPVRLARYVRARLAARQT